MTSRMEVETLLMTDNVTSRAIHRKSVGEAGAKDVSCDCLRFYWQSGTKKIGDRLYFTLGELCTPNAPARQSTRPNAPMEAFIMSFGFCSVLQPLRSLQFRPSKED